MSITMEDFKLALPPKLQKQATDDNLQLLNDILNEPEMREYYRNNLLSYSHILTEGKYSLEEYINAIKFCSFRIGGLSNKDAYIKTFPDRYKQHVANGTSQKDISSYISAYSKTKLVSTILEQSFIPSWVLNQDVYQLAINTQVDLMINADSEKVRSDAANSLLHHLKPPEASKVKLDIGIDVNGSALAELNKAMNGLRELQRASIESGNLTVIDVAESKIIEHKEDD